MIKNQRLINFIKKIIPYHFRTVIKTFYIFNYEYGHMRTAREWKCTDKSGNPLPWYTYPAIDYLEQIDFSDKTVFEYGSGYSTLYWCSRAKKVISLEAHDEWYNKISEKIPENGELILVSDKDTYPRYIYNYDFGFDVIVIDGEYRSACCEHAVKKLNRGGMIIFDNSWNHPGGCSFLRESGFIEADMVGFCPIGANTDVTSFFFHRRIQIQSKTQTSACRTYRRCERMRSVVMEMKNLLFSIVLLFPTLCVETQSGRFAGD